MKFSQTKEIITRSKMLQPFIMYTIFAYACIAGHQVGEFFSILTGSQLIYKIGLISSISSVYFGSVAIEKLTKNSIGSKGILAVIGAVSFHIFITTFDFSNHHFWVRGENHVVWSTAWFMLWTYAMISALYIGHYYTSSTNRKLLYFSFLSVMNVSFLFSLGYTFIGAYSTSCFQVTRELFNGFVFGKDFPSIWCTFSAVQAPFIYWGLKNFVTTFDVKETVVKTPHAFWLRALIIAVFTIVMVMLLKQFIPVVFGTSWKMITK